MCLLRSWPFSFLICEYYALAVSFQDVEEYALAVSFQDVEEYALAVSFQDVEEYALAVSFQDVEEYTLAVSFEDVEQYSSKLATLITENYYQLVYNTQTHTHTECRKIGRAALGGKGGTRPPIEKLWPPPRDRSSLLGSFFVCSPCW